MQLADLIDRIVRHSGLTADEAERGLLVVVRELGACVVDAGVRDVVVTAIPDELATAFLEKEPRPCSHEHFCAAIAEAEAIGRGFGVEHAQIVCGVLRDVWPAEVRRRLLAALDPEFGELFLQPEPAPEPAPVARGNTLAAGRPGSRHPLSEARPMNPSERAGRTISAGRPGGDHPLSEAKPSR